MMRKVYLVGDLAEKFGSSFKVEASTYADVIKCMHVNHPTFKKYLLESEERGIVFTFQTENEHLEVEEELLLPLKEGDITFAAVPAGSMGNDFVKTIVGATLVVVGISTGNPTLISLGTNLAMAGIQGIMSPDPATDVSEENYLFNGQMQNIIEGDPVPVFYGELRIPGRPISLMQNSADKALFADTKWEKNHSGSVDLSGNREGGVFYGVSSDVIITDVIAEGPIHGLVHGLSSVFLNDDRIQPLAQGAEQTSLGAKRLRLVSGSGTATIVTGDTFGFPNTPSYALFPVPIFKSLIIKKGFGTIAITATDNSLSLNNSKSSTLTAATSFFMQI